MNIPVNMVCSHKHDSSFCRCNSVQCVQQSTERQTTHTLVGSGVCNNKQTTCIQISNVCFEVVLFYRKSLVTKQTMFHGTRINYQN